MQINKRTPFLTDTVKRLTGINILIFFLLLLLFNILLISFINYIIHNYLDQRIDHEVENITRTLLITGGEISVRDSVELKESDLFELTENPYFLQIINDRDSVIIKSRNIDLYKAIPFNRELLNNEINFESFDLDGISHRCGYFPIRDSVLGRVGWLQLSVYEKDFTAILNELIFFNVWAVLSFLVIVIIVSVIAAKKTFKPINQIIDTAQSFDIRNLNKRIEVKAKSDDEIGRLRDTLNMLLNRIEEYVIEITNFSDHVSHQLMNPLTAIRTEIEYLIKKDRPTEEYKAALLKLAVQTESMISIIKTLLVIAKSGKTKKDVNTIFNLSKLIKNEVYNTFKENRIRYEIDENLYLRGESEKFLMVLENLLHNSLKYSPHSSDITVIAKRSDHSVVIQVEDKGIGIEDFEKNTVFQKFYRSNQVEKLGIKGFGLGLSLVKSIVDEASGQIEIINNNPQGTIFKVTVPAVDLK